MVVSKLDKVQRYAYYPSPSDLHKDQASAGNHYPGSLDPAVGLPHRFKLCGCVTETGS